MKKCNKNGKILDDILIIMEDMDRIRDEKHRRGEDGDMIFKPKKVIK